MTKPKPHQGITINSVPSEHRYVSGRGTFKYWAETVRRIGIFTGTVLDPLDREGVLNVFKEFIAQYHGVKDEKNRPFTEKQENEIWRVLAGGRLV